MATLAAQRSKAEARWASRHERLLEQSIWTFGSRLLRATFGFAASAMIARLVVPSIVGAYFLSLSVLTFASSVGQMGMPTAATRFIAEVAGRGESARIAPLLRALARILALGLGVTTAFCFLGGWSTVAVGVFHSRPIAKVAAEAVALIVLSALLNVAVGILRGFQEQRLAAVFDGLLGNVVFAIGLVILWRLGVTLSLAQLLLAQSLCVGVAVVLSIAPIRTRVRRVAERVVESDAPARSLVATGFRLMVIQLILGVLVGSVTDLWTLGAFTSTSTIAYYTADLKLAALASLPFVAFNLVVGPMIAEMRAARERGLERLVRATTGVVSVPVVLAMLVYWLAGREVLHLLYGRFYEKGYAVLVVMGAVQAMMAIAGPWETALIMMGQERLMLTLVGAAGLASAGADVAVAPRFGALGVAVASSSVLLGMHVAGVLLTKRVSGMWTCASFSWSAMRQVRAVMPRILSRQSLESTPP